MLSAPPTQPYLRGPARGLHEYRLRVPDEANHHRPRWDATPFSWYQGNRSAWLAVVEAANLVVPGANGNRTARAGRFGYLEQPDAQVYSVSTSEALDRSSEIVDQTSGTPAADTVPTCGST
jgi:hypothetical protein